MNSENDAAVMLRFCADDPMSADHAEVSKTLLRRSADEIERLRTALEGIKFNAGSPAYVYTMAKQALDA